MNEYDIPEVWRTRIRGAQRDLIRAAGGLDRVAELLKRSIGHVGRWNTPDGTEYMPLAVILILEDDTKKPVFTKVMAQMLHDRDLTEPHGGGAPDDGVLEVIAEAVESAGKFGGQALRFSADGDMSEAELRMLDRTASELERDVAEVREVAARRRSQLKLVRGG